MLKKEITYENYNGDEVTTTEWFNLSKISAMKLLNRKDAVVEKFKAFAGNPEEETRDLTPEERGMAIDFVESLVYDAYGKRDPENPETFDISKEAKDSFKKSPAFDELVYQLCTDKDGINEFLIGILPKAVREQLLAQNA